MTEYLITTEDLGRATVGDLRLYTVALPKTKRTRQAMRAWLDSAISAYRKAPNDPVDGTAGGTAGSGDRPSLVRLLFAYAILQYGHTDARLWSPADSSGESVEARAVRRLGAL